MSASPAVFSILTLLPRTVNALAICTSRDDALALLTEAEIAIHTYVSLSRLFFMHNRFHPDQSAQYVPSLSKLLHIEFPDM